MNYQVRNFATKTKDKLHNNLIAASGLAWLGWLYGFGGYAFIVTKVGITDSSLCAIIMSKARQRTLGTKPHVYELKLKYIMKFGMRFLTNLCIISLLHNHDLCKFHPNIESHLSNFIFIQLLCRDVSKRCDLRFPLLQQPNLQIVTIIRLRLGAKTILP